MVTNQAYLFLIFIINGIIIGVLFDFFRILRKTIKTKDVITYVQDILFWILTGFIVLYSTFTFNNGEIRIFMFIAILIYGCIFPIILVIAIIEFFLKTKIKNKFFTENKIYGIIWNIGNLLAFIFVIFMLYFARDDNVS